ncbi:MAG: bifunctional folylpolyglutamate synthase/dihydrofolate synthase [Atopobiaceae bacterium]|nr:bifunctional folylpolyglutamate synthase/dihydrofolate synthase [Atopobiaceae bacterium]
MSTSYDRILTRAQSHGIDPSLEPISALLRELGDPDLRFVTIQLVGTNGKTSTARYTAHILASQGLRVSLYLSPMFMSYLDQIEVEGKPVQAEELDRAVRKAYEAGRKIDAEREAAGNASFGFSEFELLTAAAALIFAWHNVDVAVVEAGMGGAWDATSAFRSIQAVCVTGIGIDHVRFLGSTPEEIARNKAAVIQTGRRCVLGQGTAMPASVEQVLLSRCEEVQVQPTLVRGEPGSGVLPTATYHVAAMPTGMKRPLSLTVRTPRATYGPLGALKPSYQAQNIACAVTLAEEYLGRALDEPALVDAVANCPTPGRFDLVRAYPPVIVDACHNPQSVATFLSAWNGMADPLGIGEQPTLLCAIFADKDVVGVVSQLATTFRRVVVTRTKASRAMDAYELAAVFESQGVVPEAAFNTVEDALRYLGERPFVACGSITVAGEVAAHFL